jgi:hypothetical protein
MSELQVELMHRERIERKLGENTVEDVEVAIRVNLNYNTSNDGDIRIRPTEEAQPNVKRILLLTIQTRGVEP